MSNIYLFGFGNLGRHLASFFLSRGIKISGIFTEQEQAHTQITLFKRIQVNQIVKSGDILFVTTNDDALIDVINGIANPEVVKIICSGAKRLSDFNENGLLGVWYPLYSFSKDFEINWNKVPIFIEYRDSISETALKKINEKLGIETRVLNSENRSKLHLAAVFANNFVNACMIASHEILSGNNQVNFMDLLPIIEQTVAKVKVNNPLVCQTGPAKRNDILTMQRHLEMLDSMKGESEVYDKFSQYIQQKLN